MTPLLLVLPYCKKDSDLLKRNLEWMFELGPEYQPHSCLLVGDYEVSPDVMRELQGLAQPMFSHVETIVVHVPAAKQNWIEGSNAMFAAAARQVAECYRLPWLWFEPDAVPLKQGWLNDLAGEYSLCAKRFMGAFIPSDGQENMPPIHMAGCGIYDALAWNGMQQFTAGKAAFDIAAARYTVPRAHHTKLIQHFWGKHDLPPVFKEFKETGDPENTLPRSFIRSDAVMWHRCKDGSLIDLLSGKPRPSDPEVERLNELFGPNPAFKDPPTKKPEVIARK